MDNQKKCFRCKEQKDKSQFSPEKSNSDGLYSICKECKAKTKKEYYYRETDKIKEYSKEYREKNREALRERSRRDYRKWRESNPILPKPPKIEKPPKTPKQKKVKPEKVSKRREPLYGSKAEYNKTYREAHKNKLNEYATKWRADNRERNKQIKKDYYYKTYSPETGRKSYLKHRDRQLVSAKQWRKNNPEKRLAQRQKRRAIKAQSGGSFTAQQWLDLCDFYNNTCLRCGIHAKDTPQGKLSPDHVIPLSKGGSSDISNIQPLCLFCNISKKDKIADYREKKFQYHKQLRLL